MRESANTTKRRNTHENTEKNEPRRGLKPRRGKALNELKASGIIKRKKLSAGRKLSNKIGNTTAKSGSDGLPTIGRDGCAIMLNIVNVKLRDTDCGGKLSLSKMGTDTRRTDGCAVVTDEITINGAVPIVQTLPFANAEGSSGNLGTTPHTEETLWATLRGWGAGSKSDVAIYANFTPNGHEITPLGQMRSSIVQSSARARR